MTQASIVDDGAIFGRTRQSWIDAAALMRLAAPLTLSALINIGISITDVVMMGWLGPVALGAGAVASDLYSIVFYFCAGVIAAVSPMIAEARGANRPREVRRVTRQAFRVAMMLSLPGAFFLWHTDTVLYAIGVQPAIVSTGLPYARMMALAFVPMMGVVVWRNFLTAHGRPRIILWIAVAALPLNALGNYLLMFGRWGFPEMGLAGAGLSSLLVGLFMFVALLVHVQTSPALRRYRLFARFLQPDGARFREILRIGVPIGLTNLGETGVFLFSTVLMGVLGAEAVAAHAIALRLAAVAYALPMGLSQAATVRIAHAIGARDSTGAARATRTAVALGSAVGAAYCAGLWGASGWLPWLFLDVQAPGAAAVAAQASLFLILLGIAELAQGPAVVGMGVLRGFKDTRVPMLLALAGYWLIGFTVAVVTAFSLGFGGAGIWAGLAAGVLAVGALIGLRLVRFSPWLDPVRTPRGDGISAVRSHIIAKPATAREGSPCPTSPSRSTC